MDVFVAFVIGGALMTLLTWVFKDVVSDKWNIPK